MRAVSFSILLLLSTCAFATERPCGSYPAARPCVRSEIVIRSRAQPVYPINDDVNIITKDDEIDVATPAPPEDIEDPEDSDEAEDSDETEEDESDENDDESDSEEQDSENEENTGNIVLSLPNVIHVDFPTYYAKSVNRNITVSVGQTEIIDFAIWDEGYTMVTAEITGYGLSADYEMTIYIQDGLPLTVSSNFVSSDIHAYITTIIPGTTVLDMDNAITRLHLLREFEYDFGSGMEEAASQNTYIAELLDEINAEPMIFKSQLAEAYARVFAKTFFDRNLFIYTGN